MASANETLQPDYSKKNKDFENTKCQHQLGSSQTPEIAPSDSCDIRNINSDTLGDVDVTEEKLNDICDADHASRAKATREISISDKTLKSEEVIFHPLQQGDDNDHNGVNADAQVTESSQVQGTNKKNRHVFFPEDGHIVSGYMEPPSPWNDVSKCSTEELINAYKKACERFEVKPLPRVLQQLNVINDFGDRNETLTLRGERLDSKHCETIEEILRRVQFRTFDLENAHLDDEGTVALFDMIEHYESCNRLNISNNRTIGIRGWQACARLMKKTPCLETLEARNCVISEQVMPFFCRSLKIGSSLTVLHLENSIVSGRHLIILAQALKMNDTLLELYLADNKLMPSDGIQLGNLLRYNFTLQLLDVRNNHLQDVGVSHICDGLWEQNHGQGLATIVLWNNQVTYQAMNSLSRALTNTKSLETLNLGHNNITNEGIHRLKDGLLRNKSLLRIGLQASKISCEGAVALAEFIAESPRLRRIDLRENDIKTGGLMALSLALKVSQSVTRIDLDKETKRELSMKDYAEQQQRLMNDINNYMQRNRELVRLQEEQNEKQRQQQREVEEANKDSAPESSQDTRSNNEDTANVEQTTAENTNKEDTTEQGAGHEPLSRGQHHHQRPLNLDLNSCRGPHTLDSPALLADSTFAVFSDTLQQESNVGQEKRGDSENVQFFPPSPMVSSNGRPTLAPILGSAPSVISPEAQDSVPTSVSMLSAMQSSTMPKEVLRKSPCSSPTTKRKFIISRVQEPPRSQTALSPTTEQHSGGGDILPADVPSRYDSCDESAARDAASCQQSVTDSASPACVSLADRIDESTAETSPSPDVMAGFGSEAVSALSSEQVTLASDDEKNQLDTEAGSHSTTGVNDSGQQGANPASDGLTSFQGEVENCTSDKDFNSAKEVSRNTANEGSESLTEVGLAAPEQLVELNKEVEGPTSDTELSELEADNISSDGTSKAEKDVGSSASGLAKKGNDPSQAEQLPVSSCAINRPSSQLTDSSKIHNSSEINQHDQHITEQSKTGNDSPLEEQTASDDFIKEQYTGTPSQVISENAKTVSELSSMNGVSQNIGNVHQEPDQNLQGTEADVEVVQHTEPTREDGFDDELAPVFPSIDQQIIS